MSITTAVRSLRRNALKQFTGAAEADINTYLSLIFEAAILNPGRTYKDEEAVAFADQKLAEAAEVHETWAVNLRDAVLINIIKPIVDKAEGKGVDPVAALMLEDYSEEQARQHVASLESRSREDNDAAASADDDSDDDSFENEDDTTSVAA